MASTPELALLALRVYGTPGATDGTNIERNRPAVPEGWTEREWHADDGRGFSYGVYTRGSEVVIPYAGTNQGIDWIANGTNGAGLSSGQTTSAAIAYLQAKQQYGGNITFTGHSLGGGLASMMSVWFDRPAIVFDEAPFELTARFYPLVQYTKLVLELAGYTDPAFASYTGLLDFYTREGQVQNHYVGEEALQIARMLFPTIMGTGADNRMEFGVNNMLSSTGRVDLHSQALLAAGSLSTAFREGTIAVQQTLPLLMNKNFYAFSTADPRENVLINFIRGEQGAGDKLTHFGGDLAKLGGIGLPNAMQIALIGQCIEWYYWQPTNYPGTEFFKQTDALLQYTIALGAGLLNAENKAGAYVEQWLKPLLAAQGITYSTSFVTFDQWNVATGSGATGTAQDADKDQIFIGSGSGDDFTGGNLNDVLFGGEGADTLRGEGGNDDLYGSAGGDQLFGGAGYDTYRIDGNDTVTDSDGVGTLEDKTGRRIAGAVEKRDDGTYVFLSDSSITVTGGTDLKLTLADGSSVTIKDFQDGNLGIQLSTTGAASQIDRTIVGDLAPVDQSASTPGVQTANDELDNVIVNPGQVEANRDDTLYDSSGNDDIQGKGGNDFVWAFRGGADRIDGGTGNDVMLAGDGDDIVVGGAGNDVLHGERGSNRLYGGAQVTIEEAFAAQDDPPSGLKGEFIAGGSEEDIIVGDTGNDLLTGGGGDDIVLGGAGDDNILPDVVVTGVGFDWSVTRSVTTSAGGSTVYGYSLNNVGTSGPSALSGNDVVFAGGGADWVLTGIGDDYVDAGSGDDVVFSHHDNDEVFGGSGNDVLVGDGASVPVASHGDDYLDGEAGDDELWGDGGDDVLFGGEGNDLLIADLGPTGAGSDYLDGEDGNDRVVGGARDDQLFGGAGNDMMQGDSGSRTLDGNDYLDGEAGNDTLFGEGGQDEIHGGDDADYIAGDHGGTDASGEADQLYGGAGNDTITGQGGDDILDGGLDNDLIGGGAGADRMDGGAGLDQLQGGEGDDTVYGGDGLDTLYGESGNDVLYGGADRDYLFGDEGDDTLDGGDGDDIYIYNFGDGNDHISDSGGTDWLVFSDITWGQLALGVGSLKLTVPGGSIHLDDFDPDNPFAAGGIEYFQFADNTVLTKAQLINLLGFTPTGTPGPDALSGTALSDTVQGLAGDDVINARAGNDTVFADGGEDQANGGDGNDILNGGDGNDILSGDGGNDTVNGDGGNDMLTGGAGTDALFGGEGDDTYFFQAGDGSDTATDTVGQNGVQLGGGLTLGSVIFSRAGNDLVVAIRNTADSLTVKEWFAPDSHFATVSLGDGTVLDHAGVDAAMPANQLPSVLPDSALVIEDSILAAAGNALANDSDPEGQALRVTNPGSHMGTYGSLSLQSGGGYEYTLANGSAAVQSLGAGQSVTDTFTYTVTDDDPAGAASAQGSIIVTVHGTNDLPTLGTDTASIAEDAALVTGNVIANDTDADAGAVLAVANPGVRAGTYGSLNLGANGGWVYTLANASAPVQGLAAGQTVTENFGFLVGDGTAQVNGGLTVSVSGVNDAPILVTALMDQAASANTSWQWQLPAGSFTDVDTGDALTYRATLADGSALPSWLTFSPATQTFSGRVPRDATGTIDIKVDVADGSQATASDIFTLNFSGGGTGGGGGGGGNGGGNGGGSTGNEGVGNGVDGPPPGHDDSFNDGEGTGPGSPGAQGGNPMAPGLGHLALIDIAIYGLTTVPSNAPVHGELAAALADAPGQVKKAAAESAEGYGPEAPQLDPMQEIALVGLPWYQWNQWEFDRP
ncbi:MAG: VCBS domain-containing protein [Ramlibacter sp.]|nr:VCBS domain-containing protein [Ramlibacter sp.]